MASPAPIRLAQTLRANLRWQVIALIFAGTILNYLARNSLGVLAPLLQARLHISTAQYSYVVGAFQLAYTLMLPVCGLVLDRVGLRLGFAVFAAIWSLANMAHAMAVGWLSLAVLRGVLGMAEAAVIPAGVKASTEWFPARERAAAIGWVNIGTALGAVLAVPIVSTLALWFDWQAAFLFTGLAGLAYAGAWYVFYRRPSEHPRLTEAEAAHILDGRAEVPAIRLRWAEIRTLLADPTFRTIAIPRFLAEPAWQTFSFWIPLYLAKERGMDLKHIAMFAWLPFLTADLGGLAGGYISPFIARVTHSPLIRARVIGVSLAAILMIGPGCIGLVASPYAALALLCLGGFAHQTLSVLINTFTADCYPSARVGTANGFVSQAGWFGGLLFSLAIGQLADKVGFTPLFGALGVFDLVGALVLWLGLRHLLRAAGGLES